jgi:hypothetical protein
LETSFFYLTYMRMDLGDYGHAVVLRAGSFVGESCADHPELGLELGLD